jgi:hypothetical protein
MTLQSVLARGQLYRSEALDPTIADAIACWAMNGTQTACGENVILENSTALSTRRKKSRLGHASATGAAGATQRPPRRDASTGLVR